MFETAINNLPETPSGVNCKHIIIRILS